MGNTRQPGRLVLVLLAIALGPLVSHSHTEADAAADAPGGDPARGATLFQHCAACHSVEPGVHLTGPSLAAIWNQRAGSVPGFARTIA